MPAKPDRHNKSIGLCLIQHKSLPNISFEYMKNPGKTTDQAALDIIYNQDFITIYQGLDKELCRTIIEMFDSDPSKWRGKIGSSKEAYHEDDAKVSWDLEILNQGNWQAIFQNIQPKIERCMSEYIARSPILSSFALQASGFKIQMYPQNEGYFRWHADAVGGSSGDRVVAMVLYLNDVAKGGETEFFHQEIKVTPRAGHLVLFPAGWNYMHCAHKPESGNKYIISTFIKIKP
jgi:Rps23 Pro-64 3,4-dihydroxylase Tpa1-like proline 4-hydroxylase